MQSTKKETNSTENLKQTNKFHSKNMFYTNQNFNLNKNNQSTSKTQNLHEINFEKDNVPQAGQEFDQKNKNSNFELAEFFYENDHLETNSKIFVPEENLKFEKEKTESIHSINDVNIESFENEMSFLKRPRKKIIQKQLHQTFLNPQLKLPLNQKLESENSEWIKNKNQTASNSLFQKSSFFLETSFLESKSFLDETKSTDSSNPSNPSNPSNLSNNSNLSSPTKIVSQIENSLFQTAKFYFQNSELENVPLIKDSKIISTPPNSQISEKKNNSNFDDSLDDNSFDDFLIGLKKSKTKKNENFTSSLFKSPFKSPIIINKKTTNSSPSLSQISDESFIDDFFETIKAEEKSLKCKDSEKSKNDFYSIPEQVNEKALIDYSTSNSITFKTTPVTPPPFKKRILRSSPFSITSHHSSSPITSTPSFMNSKDKAINKSPNRPIKKSRLAFATPPKFELQNNAISNKNLVYSTIKPIEKRSSPIFDLSKSETLKRIKLSDFYKSGKSPKTFSVEQLYSYNLTNEVIFMDSEKAKYYLFKDLDGDNIGPTQFFEILLKEGVSPKLLTLEWVKNHFRWIVWKLASMERSFPEEYATKYLTPERVLSQLKYRYEREINNFQRPALRSILENDKPPSLHMVLCVASIKSSIENQDLTVLEITDGWYSIDAQCDFYLSILIKQQKIYIGQKLHVFGSSFIGDSAPYSPLEYPFSKMLYLHFNGTRIARWDTTLGFQKQRYPTVSLSSLKPDGGFVPRIDTLILRAYPITYFEFVEPSTDQDFNRVKIKRNDKGEEIAFEQFLEKKNNWLQKTQTSKIKQINSNFETLNDSDESLLSLNKEQIELLEREINDAAKQEPWLQRNVSSCMRLLLCDYPNLKNSVLCDAILSILSQGIEKFQNLSTVQKRSIEKLGKATLTLWNVSKEEYDTFNEGSRLQITYLSCKSNTFKASPSKGQEKSINSESFNFHVLPNVQLSNNSNTKAKVLASHAINIRFINLFRRCYTPFNNLNQHIKLQINSDCDSISPDSLIIKDRFGKIEIFDTVGFLISVTSPKDLDSNKTIQNLFLVDPSLEILIVRYQTLKENLPSPFLSKTVTSFKNLSYFGYDSKLKAHVANANEETECIFKSPGPAHLAQERLRIQNWVNSSDFLKSIDSTTQKVLDLIKNIF